MRPGRVKLRTEDQYQEQAGHRGLLDEKTQPLERGGVSPVEVLTYHEQRMALCLGTKSQLNSASWVFSFCFWGVSSEHVK
jgi:hypothetical protein